jgi:hypothetical protein
MFTSHRHVLSNLRNFRTNQTEVAVPDNTNLAELLYRKVRVLCMILTDNNGVNNQGNYIMETWGKRCNKIIFFSDKPSKKEQNCFDRKMYILTYFYQQMQTSQM